MMTIECDNCDKVIDAKDPHYEVVIEPAGCFFWLCSPYCLWNWTRKVYKDTPTNEVVQPLDKP